MEYRELGNSGLLVSAYSLGSWMFGAPNGNRDPGECQAIIHAALDAGISLIDTADVYGSGEAERLIGLAIRDRRKEVVLCGKVGYPTPKGGGLSSRWILESIERTLRRLQTDYLDVYLLHRPDPSIRIEESLAALDQLVRSGRIRVGGCSTFPAWQIAEARLVAEREGLAVLGCEQPPYSILVRSAEFDVFPVAQRYAMGVLVWSPLAGGWLTGKYRSGALPDRLSRGYATATLGVENPRIAERYNLTALANRSKFSAVEKLAALADDSALPLAGLAMAFTQSHPAVTSAILGVRTLAQLEELTPHTELRLEPALLDEIDKIVAPGSVLNDADRGWDPPWMQPDARRRPIAGR